MGRNDGRSGYVSLPPRVLIREFDNATGSYPTILRTGDIDRQGNYKVQFDDTNTLIFGEKIEDNFTLADDKELALLNNRKWTKSPGMRIRRESLKARGGKTSNSSAAVFAGTPVGAGRWIQTKVKIRNPIVVLNLIQGPHNIIKSGLNLVAGDVSETLKIQLSTDGTNYTTVKTFTPTTILSSFYDNLNSSNVNIHERYRKKVELGFSDFYAPGNTFYLRILQDTITDVNKAVWAISNIRIISMNQDVRYPLLADHGTRHGRAVERDNIITPHSKSTLTAKGRTVSGITDTMLRFTPGEEISPFNEQYAVEDSQKQFFEQGTDPNTLRGFSQKLGDKTKIILNLSTSNETHIGYGMTFSGSEVDLANRPMAPENKLMAYWNDTLKKWETIAYGVNDNSYDFKGVKTGNFLSLIGQITSSAVGFGPMGVVSTGSSPATTLSKSRISTYARPTKTFGFPFDGRYHATGSQTISLRNYINQPFLLEKAVIQFHSMFEFADGIKPKAREAAFALKNQSSSFGANFTYDEQAKYYIPTFFMLNQKQDNFYKSVDYVLIQEGIVTSSNYNVSIPGNFDLGNGTMTRIQDTRELVTYGQLGILLSGSENGVINPTEVLDRGLRREALLILTSSTTSLTGNFQIEFESKISRRYNATADTVNLINYTTAPFKTGSLLFDDRLGGRGYGGLDSSTRALANGFPGFRPGGTSEIASYESGYDPLSVAGLNFEDETESFDFTSPYILFPDDEIVLGFQYPLCDNVLQNNATSFPILSNSFTNRMTLTGDARLILYGSLIKNNVEHHNTLNQNLTSPAVHEMIGSEPIVDQYQIASRGEFSGSYIDDLIFRSSPYRFGAAVGRTPSERIGKPIISKVNFDVDKPLGGLKLLSGSITRFVLLQDSARKFKDSTVTPLDIDKNLRDITYGTYQSNKIPLKPKYYYNYRHFGFHCDMIKQGPDTAFNEIDIAGDVSTQQIAGTAQSIGPAVSIVFVSGSSTSLGTTNIKSFEQASIGNLLADPNFQSSNINVAATSSYPFTDDLALKNRSYI